MVMRKLILLLIVLFSTTSNLIAQQKATTENGRKIILNDNGTWTYADSSSFGKAVIPNISNIEIPKINSKDVVISHT